MPFNTHAFIRSLSASIAACVCPEPSGKTDTAGKAETPPVLTVVEPSAPRKPPSSRIVDAKNRITICKRSDWNRTDVASVLLGSREVTINEGRYSVREKPKSLTSASGAQLVLVESGSGHTPGLVLLDSRAHTWITYRVTAS